MASACRRPSSGPSTGPWLHGATGTPVFSARTLASILAPSRRIASGGGPTKVTPRSAHSSAKAGSSATKPQPTQAASAPLARRAGASSAWSRYGLPVPSPRSRTASSAARTNVARRSSSVCNATTRVPEPCSALSSRTARISRRAGSPRFTTAMRSNTRALSSVRWVLPTAPGRLHVQAAVDAPDLTGDVAGGVRGEEVHDPGDLLRLAQPADRDLGLEALEHLLRHALEHLGGGVARRHGVDRDAQPVGLAGALHLHRGLPGQRLRQAQQPGLGRGVVGLPDAAHLADDRGDHHDPPAAALEHVPERGLRQVEGARQVDFDDPAPVVVGHLQHGAVDGDARVVDQDVEPAVLLDDLGDGAPAVVGVRDVALVHGEALVGEVAAELLAEALGGLVVAAVAGGDVGALGGHAAADGRTDPPGAAGHERHAAGELVARPAGPFLGRCHRFLLRLGRVRLVHGPEPGRCDRHGSGSGYRQHGAERAARQDRRRLPPATTRRAVAQVVARVRHARSPTRGSRPGCRAPSCRRVPPSGQWPALPPPTDRTAMRTPTRRTVTTAVAGLTGLCAAVLVPTVAAAHAGPEPHGWVETAWLTGYSLEDNSPAGTRATSSGRKAGGTGTFDDPITLAVGYAGGDEFPVGTVFYVPLVRAYFVVEDRCGGCSDATDEGEYTIDLWVGSDPDASCMYAITGAHTVVRDATRGWAVEYRPYELGSDCSLFGETP